MARRSPEDNETKIRKTGRMVTLIKMNLLPTVTGKYYTHNLTN